MLNLAESFNAFGFSQSLTDTIKLEKKDHPCIIPALEETSEPLMKLLEISSPNNSVRFKMFVEFLYVSPIYWFCF